MRAYLRSHVNKRYAGDRGLTLTQRSTLTFHWAIAVGGAIHEEDVHVRADHAAERGIPFPATWKSDLALGASGPAVEVEALARSAVHRVRDELRLSEAVELTCRLICTHVCTLTHVSDCFPPVRSDRSHA